MNKDIITIKGKLGASCPTIEFEELTQEEIVNINYKEGVYSEFQRDAIVLASVLKDMLPTPTYEELVAHLAREMTLFEKAVRAVDLLKPSEKKILRKML